MPPDTSVGDGLLARALTDATTGLPSILYFRLIRDWEQRRAERRGYRVRVVRLTVAGGDERLRKSLSWRICREFRSSDLIASDGPSHYRLLLTSPDAENIDIMRQRLEQLAVSVNEKVAKDAPIQFGITLEEERPVAPAGPCEPCDVDHLGDTGEGEAIGDTRRGATPRSSADSPESDPTRRLGDPEKRGNA